MKILGFLLVTLVAAAPVQAGSGVSAPDTLDSMAPVIVFQYPANSDPLYSAQQETIRFTIDEPSWGPPAGQVVLSFHIDGSPMTQVTLDPEPDGSYAYVWDVPGQPLYGEVEGRLRVMAADRFGWLGLRYSPWFLVVDNVSPVPQLRFEDHLGPVHPNPFNPRTTVSYSLASPAEVRLEVYDLRGRLVAVLDEGSRSAGDHDAVWLGRADDGRPAASGTYFARLEIRSGNETRTLTARLALVK